MSTNCQLTVRGPAQRDSSSEVPIGLDLFPIRSRRTGDADEATGNLVAQSARLRLRLRWPSHTVAVWLGLTTLDALMTYVGSSPDWVRHNLKAESVRKCLFSAQPHHVKFEYAC